MMKPETLPTAGSTPIFENGGLRAYLYYSVHLIICVLFQKKTYLILRVLPEKFIYIKYWVNLETKYHIRYFLLSVEFTNKTHTVRWSEHEHNL